MKVIKHLFIACFLLVNLTVFSKQLPNDSTAKQQVYYFISNRDAADGTFNMYKARTNQSGISSALVKGNFEVKGYPHMRKAEISVYNIATDELVGVYKTNPKTGNYLVILIPNVKYEFVINTYGYAPIKKIVEVPANASTNVLDNISTQTMLLNIDKEPVQLSVDNKFSEEKQPTLFLLTVYDENLDSQERVELYESEIFDPEEENRREFKEIQFENIDDALKKQAELENKKPEIAEKAFLKKEYKTAVQLYKELLELDADDVMNNYKMGISTYFTEQNKIKALPYLLKAAYHTEVPYDVYYYLGKTYHHWADFAKAEEFFKSYQQKASEKEVSELNINQLIENCSYGKKFVQEQYNLEIIEKKPVSLSKINKLFPEGITKDNMMEKTAFFISPIDAKKKTPLWMFKSQQNEMIQTSYGLSESNGKDLFVNYLIGGDKWSVPKTLGNNINTIYDEDYAYITPDGKTLYFSSKGHSSMGGYDIFKSTREHVTDAWSHPENLGYPINSPFDDFLFVPSENGNDAYFISNRRNASENYELYKIKLPKAPLPLTIIKGHFMTQDTIPDFEATITVYNSNNQEVAGIYNTNVNTGNYLMALIPGVKYELSIITNINYREHTAYVTIPFQNESFPLRQNIRLKKEGRFEILNVDNYFTQEEAENAPVYQFTKKDFEIPVADKTPPTNTSKNKIKILSPEQKQLINDAQQFFINKQYLKAAQAYEKIAPLIDLTEKQAYMYGKSLFNVSKDYENMLVYLELASKSKQVPYDVFYMLGKTNHLAYRFERAVIAYEKYKSMATPEELEEKEVENEITLSKYGKQIINQPKPIEVIEKKQVKSVNFHTIYGSVNTGAKFIVAPEDMLSAVDIKKGYRPIMYLNASKTVIYYSSYGENESNGKDIYMLKKLPDNTWTVPMSVGTAINTSQNEEYPFLSEDGKTLYFCSNAHGSMGGMDVFKSHWDSQNNSWSKPINLGAPINSPFDDLFYVEER